MIFFILAYTIQMLAFFTATSKGMRNHLTENELLNENQRQLYQINTLIKKNLLSLDDLEELIPGWFHLNSIHDFSLTGVGKNICNYFNIEDSYIYTEGFEFLRKVTCPETQKHAIPILTRLIADNNETKVTGFFQRLKRIEDTEYKLFYTTSKLFDDGKTFISVTNQLDHLHDLYPKIEKIFDENLILKKYYARFSTLTQKEKAILTMIAKGFTSGEISRKMCRSKLTVDKHRQNIMKKLEVKRIAELIRIAHTFDII